MLAENVASVAAQTLAPHTHLIGKSAVRKGVTPMIPANWRAVWLDVLQVKGDSMKDAGIMDGDVVVVTHQNTADNGDIVVAMVDDAVTLKRFYIEKNRVRLKAENPKYPPLFTQNVRILGKLAFLMRTYP